MQSPRSVYMNFLHTTSPQARATALLLTGGLFGALGMYAYTSHVASVTPNLTEVRANAKEYQFINPLLFYKSNPDPDYAYIQNKLGAYVQQQKGNGNAQNISVYFRDMNTGEWTGIQETDNYEPASMLKVTMMLAYLKRSVEQPDILNQEVPYTATKLAEETYKANNRLQSGSYSVDTLITKMIINSDNDALTALSKDDDGHTADIFTLFQLPLPSPGTNPDYISARVYSRIFRVLYDSTYLPWDFSERALRLLSQTVFNVGLVAGVPSDTIVSHKFGERTELHDNGVAPTRELHDCGIIYKPHKPYFLCVMTRGSDFAKLQTIISDISRITYQSV